MAEFIKPVRIEPSWGEALKEPLAAINFERLRNFLTESRAKGITIFPPGPLIFNAFDKTPFQAVKVVILGQDPYHNPGEAMGLSFSVPQNVRVPPSLRNIFTELNSDLGIEPPPHGDLTSWATQGVLLLNAILTVEAEKPASHKDIGWQYFTDAVIRSLSQNRRHLVFMLWGNFARSKKNLINPAHHLILEAAHPSPLARDAFKGCRHFSKANQYLMEKGIDPIRWGSPQSSLSDGR